jgi:predicted Zn-dependent protease
VFALALAACATSPTGRNQLLLYSDAELDQMGAASFEQQKQEIPLSTNAVANRYVECVAQAIIAQLEPAQRSGWEVRVFETKDVNAFALPGRKVGVFTGLLQVATTQDQLAAVLGHEVGHVLAQHGNERVSQQSMAQLSQAAVAAAVSSADMGTQTGQLVMAGLGLGTQYGVLLPFSRSHESEADEIGIDLMAKAGFDPRASVVLWQNMGAAAGGAAPPEWGSTHPSNETRIRDLESLMPEAQKTAAAANAAGLRPRCTPS